METHLLPTATLSAIFVHLCGRVFQKIFILQNYHLMYLPTLYSKLQVTVRDPWFVSIFAYPVSLCWTCLVHVCFFIKRELIKIYFHMASLQIFTRKCAKTGSLTHFASHLLSAVVSGIINNYVANVSFYILIVSFNFPPTIAHIYYF